MVHNEARISFFLLQRALNHEVFFSSLIGFGNDQFNGGILRNCQVVSWMWLIFAQKTGNFAVAVARRCP